MNLKLLSKWITAFAFAATLTGTSCKKSNKVTPDAGIKQEKTEGLPLSLIKDLATVVREEGRVNKRLVYRVKSDPKQREWVWDQKEYPKRPFRPAILSSTPHKITWLQKNEYEIIGEAHDYSLKKEAPPFETESDLNEFCKQDKIHMSYDLFYRDKELTGKEDDKDFIKIDLTYLCVVGKKAPHIDDRTNHVLDIVRFDDEGLDGFMKNLTGDYALSDGTETLHSRTKMPKCIEGEVNCWETGGRPHFEYECPTGPELSYKECLEIREGYQTSLLALAKVLIQDIKETKQHSEKRK